MMASSSTLGLSSGSRIEPKPQGRFCLPRNHSRPQGPVAQSEKGRVTRLRCGSFARSVYHRRIILFTRLLEGVTKNRRISPRVSENYFGSCRRRLSGYMKKAPRVGATSLRTQVILGGDSVCLLVGDFFFGAEPVFHCVTVLTATCLVKFVSS